MKISLQVVGDLIYSAYLMPSGHSGAKSMRQTKFRNLTAVFYCAVRNIFLLRTVVCAVLLPCCGANIVVWAYRCYVCRPAAHAICFTAGYGLAISRTCGVIKKIDLQEYIGTVIFVAAEKSGTARLSQIETKPSRVKTRVYIYEKVSLCSMRLDI